MKELFKDDNGKTSFSRVFTAIIIVFYLMWTSYIAYHTKELPDIPENLYLLLLSLYGVNKVATAIKSFGASK